MAKKADLKSGLSRSGSTLDLGKKVEASLNVADQNKRKTPTKVS